VDDKKLRKDLGEKGNLFRRDASIIVTNHFEDTPREAVKAKTLAASLLLGPIFPR
jgi:hypothetical protein